MDTPCSEKLKASAVRPKGKDPFDEDNFALDFEELDAKASTLKKPLSNINVRALSTSKRGYSRQDSTGMFPNRVTALFGPFALFCGSPNDIFIAMRSINGGIEQ
jgi:hypothetical protein